LDFEVEEIYQKIEAERGRMQEGVR
jgi:hypothetical protein